MQSGNSDFSEIGPRPDIIANAAGEDCARLGVDEQRWHVAFFEPAAVLVDDGDDFGRLAVDGYVAWPRQGRSPVLAGVDERLPVVVHLLVGEFSPDRAGQHPFDKGVLLQHHSLTVWRPEALEHTSHAGMKVR